jgi:hypothetical protein
LLVGSLFLAFGMRNFTAIALFALCVVFTTVVTAAEEKATTVTATGTVTHIELEGGFWAIIADDGAKYDPMELGKEFQQEGLRVTFTAKIRTDMVSDHMYGTIIEITAIAKAPAPAKDAKSTDQK